MYKRKKCIVCSEFFKPTSSTQKYCIRCGRVKREEYIKERNKNYYHNPKNKERIKRWQRENYRKPGVKARAQVNNKKWRMEHLEKRREHYKNYYHNPKNKEKVKVRVQVYREKNKAKIKAYFSDPENKARAKKRKERPEIKIKIKKQHKKYRDKPESKVKKNKKEKARRKNDTPYNIQCLIRQNFYHAMNNYSKKGKIRPLKKYGLDLKAIIRHLGKKPNDGKNYHIDHIFPVRWFNHNNPQEIKWCWSPHNLQWLREDINLWKGGRFMLKLTLKEQSTWMEKDKR